MTQEEIRLQKELCFANIKLSESRLEDLRNECEHPNTFEVLWEGDRNCYNAIICSDCGALVKTIDIHLTY